MPSLRFQGIRHVRCSPMTSELAEAALLPLGLVTRPRGWQLRYFPQALGFTWLLSVGVVSTRKAGSGSLLTNPSP